MSRSYTKMEEITAAVFVRKVTGEKNKQIGESYGLNKVRIHESHLRKSRVVKSTG